jgi:hypothetical protein
MSLNIPYPLSPTQVESFHRDGYLLIADALSPSDIQDIQAWSAEVKAWPNRVGEHMPYEEKRADGSTGLCRTESKCFTDRVRLMTDYANYHDGFGRLFRGDKLTGILTELMGEQAVLFKEKVGVSAEYPFSRDRSTTRRPEGREALTLTLTPSESSL